MSRQTRREFLKKAGSLAVSAEVLSVLPGCSGINKIKATDRKHPNVILIMTDDQGWGDVHSHGNDKIDTPVMDKLAADGARFERFFVSPVCAPTRASLLTGREVSTAGRVRRLARVLLGGQRCCAVPG